MRKHVLLIALVLAAFSTTRAEAAAILFKATLDGATENPAVVTPGTGTALVIYDDVAHTLEVQIEFQGLVGNTSVAHIHCCADPPNNVNVATFPGTFPGFPVGVQQGTYAGSWTLLDSTSYTASFFNDFGGGTVAGAEAALLAGMLSGRAYVNIHTDLNPNGEIRGFLTPVPEPGTLVIVGLGAAALLVRRRKGAFRT